MDIRNCYLKVILVFSAYLLYSASFAQQYGNDQSTVNTGKHTHAPSWLLGEERAVKIADKPSPPLIQKCDNCSELLEKAKKEGQLEIVIMFHISSLPVENDRMSDKQRDIIQAQTAAMINQAVENLRTKIKGHQFKILRKYSLIPSLFLSVDEDALRIIIDDPDVETISEQQIMKTSLMDSACSA